MTAFEPQKKELNLFSCVMWDKISIMYLHCTYVFTLMFLCVTRYKTLVDLPRTDLTCLIHFTLTENNVVPTHLHFILNGQINQIKSNQVQFRSC